MKDLTIPYITPTELVTHKAELIEVGTDQHAVEIWLGSYSRGSAHTVRNFRREAERFLIWLEAVKGLRSNHLPDVLVEDANQYLDFLADPRLFSNELLHRYGRKTQPFRGPLSRASMRQTIVILHCMFEALRNVRGSNGLGYISMNPFILVRDMVTIDHEEEVEEALSQDEWMEVLLTIEDLPKDTSRDLAHYHRARWLFQLLYRAFLRRDEAAQLKMGNFIENADGWNLKFIGKGQKKARIIATTKLMGELRVYRLFHGLSAFPSPGEDRPALLSVNGQDQAIGDQLIYLICKEIFQATADRIEVTKPTSAAHLRQATPHWMRHTGITHSLEEGIDPRYVQAQARHASLSTTARYDHKERKRWREQLERV